MAVNLKSTLGHIKAAKSGDRSVESWCMKKPGARNLRIEAPQLLHQYAETKKMMSLIRKFKRAVRLRLSEMETFNQNRS